MRRFTHVLALLATSAYTFMLTPAGQALVHQYPILTAVVGGLTTVLALYHQPKEGA